MNVLRRALLLVPFIALASAAEKPRVLVLTDISSLTQGVREPDDGQSLIRFLLFSNDFDVEGILATSNMRHGQTTRPELVRQAIDAYALVWRNLRRHDSAYPAPLRLRERVKSGQPVAGPDIPVTECVGEGKDTEASEWIVRAARKNDKRPLWVLIWGGSADLAQALWRTRDDAALRSKLRVHAIYDQDSTGPWIRKTFPDLSYIVRRHGVRGMYRGGDASLVSTDWVATHVRTDHGPLGALYPSYNGGDIWSGKLGRVLGIKEGDTPSFLSLIPNGLNVPERLDLGGWGGRVVNHEDAIDGDAPPDDLDPRMISVYRWRSDWQAEFQARLDWCVRSPREVNHPPAVKLKVNGRELDARGSSDPDRGDLTYEWLIYPRKSAGVRIEANGPTARVVMEPGVKSAHVVLAVRDSGTPALTRYARAEVFAHSPESGKSWELLGEGYQLTADSAVDPAGNVYFTDNRKNRILKIDLDGNISTWKDGSNDSHGVAWGADGRLYAGQHDFKRVVAFSMDGTESVIAEGVQGHHLTVTSRNEIYLTQPPLHTVWLITKDGTKRAVDEGIHWPRGVQVSANGSQLVVTDPPTPWVWRFQIQRDGSLRNGQRFCRLENRAGSSETDSGSMAFDSKGLLYVATDRGVQVCDQRGRMMQIIDGPRGGAVNTVLFAGPGRRWLYVTDGERFWRRPSQRAGAVQR